MTRSLIVLTYKVNEEVCSLMGNNEIYDFHQTPVRFDEVHSAIKRLHRKKSEGIDNISTEYTVHSGSSLVSVLVLHLIVT